MMILIPLLKVFGRYQFRYHRFVVFHIVIFWKEEKSSERCMFCSISLKIFGKHQKLLISAKEIGSSLLC